MEKKIFAMETLGWPKADGVDAGAGVAHPSLQQSRGLGGQ